MGSVLHSLSVDFAVIYPRTSMEVPMANPKKTPRRLPTHGSYGSAYMESFATVARSQIDGDLTKHGETHVCDSAFLAERGIFTRPEATKQQHAARPGAHAI
jgi:hypothetical protein